MPQDTFNYMDELQRRLDEVMNQPMSDYQPEQTPIQKLRGNDWEYVKGLLNDYLGWRATVNPYPSSIEEAKNPSDEQLMSMAMFAGPAGAARGWEKTAETLATKRAPTSWGVSGKHWKAPPEFEGMSSKDWVAGKSQANDAIDQIMSQFTPAGERLPPPKGPRSMPWDEVASKAGIDPAFPQAMPKATTPGVSRAPAGPEVLADRTVMTPWEDVARRIGINEGEVNRLGGGIDWTTPGAAPVGGPGMGGKSYDMREEAASLLQKVLGPNVSEMLSQLYGDVSKLLPNRTNAGKVLDALTGAAGVGWYGANHPHGWLFGAENRPTQNNAGPLRPAITPQGIEQERMRQEGMYIPDQYSDEMRKKRFGY